MRMCVLDEEKSCIECGQCNICDLNPNKICDNCCRCLEIGEEEFALIEIDDILLNEEEDGSTD